MSTRFSFLWVVNKWLCGFYGFTVEKILGSKFPFPYTFFIVKTSAFSLISFQWKWLDYVDVISKLSTTTMMSKCYSILLCIGQFFYSFVSGWLMMKSLKVIFVFVIFFSSQFSQHSSNSFILFLLFIHNRRLQLYHVAFAVLSITKMPYSELFLGRLK